MSQENITISLNSQAQTGGIMAIVNGLKQVKETAAAAGLSLGDIATKLGGVLVGVLGFGGFIHMTKDAIDHAADLGKAASKTGMAIEELSAITAASRLPVETLQLGMRGLSEWLGKTGQSGRNLSEVILEQADIFSNLADGDEKIRLSRERFGRSGQEMIPFLNRGSEAIKQQIEVAKSLGVVVSTDFAKNAKEFNRNLYIMKSFTLGLFESIAEAILPGLIAATGKLVDWAKSSSGHIRETIEGTVEAIRHGYSDSLAPSIVSVLGSAVESVGHAFGVMSKGAVANLGLIKLAIDAIVIALGVLSIQAAIAGGAMLSRFITPMTVFFGMMNTRVALFSRYGGLILGIGSAFTTWGSALSVVGALLGGIQLGRMIGDVDLLGKGMGKFGATINDTVTFYILKAMEAWEKLKLSMGAGSREQVAAASAAVQDFLAPKEGPAKGNEAEKEAAKPHFSPATVLPLDQYRMEIEAIALRIDLINKETSISDEERNKELKELYGERIALTEKLQAAIVKDKTMFVADANGVRFTQESVDVLKEQNILIKDQAESKEKILQTERNLFAIRQKSLDVDMAKADLEVQQLSARGVKSGGRVAGSLQEEGDAIEANLKRMRQLAIEKAALTAQEKGTGLLSARDAQLAEIQNAERLLDIERKIAALKEQRNDYSFIEKMRRNLQDLGDEFRHVGAAIADTLTSGIKGAIDVVSRGLWQVIDGTATWGQLFLQVGRQIISSLIQIAIQELIVDQLKRGLTIAWVAFKSAMGWGEQADHAAQKTTEVSVHATAETTKTGATMFGAIGRGVIRLGETIYHGILTVVKVAAHLAGEAAMTAGTIFNAAIRMPITLLEAGKDLIGAAFKAAKAVADIPFVGPILAIAAMATIIGAGVKYMGGFEEGGMLHGGPQLIQVNENGQESILNARATAMLGEDTINAMNAGYFDLESRMASRVMEVPQSSSHMAPSMGQQSGSQGTGQVSIILVDSRNSQAARDFMESSSGRAIIVEVVRDQKVEVGIG